MCSEVRNARADEQDPGGWNRIRIDDPVLRRVCRFLFDGTDGRGRMPEEILMWQVQGVERIVQLTPGLTLSEIARRAMFAQIEIDGGPPTPLIPKVTPKSLPLVVENRLSRAQVTRDEDGCYYPANQDT